ncbi:carotenoid oxygenase family protein [Nostoc sp. FACHB-280]|uniref:carotenoid oxygenase family protein n=1 Tax=Nostoc sp. FACHB-280 TaxID=2692839 RepID=UPI00168C04B1|nr:carotenoid oxygenase family protein [Nostoc sp. FACHB-280]MBD2495032.1 carotenoid oxygenase family protein [Nostoc sp. FACHB-280]
MTTTAVNPYLDGNFAPISAEITAENLQVIGELPPELSGMFVRNGPNPQYSPLGQYHWFDGDGMLHGVRISGGKAVYRNRYVQTQKWQTEHEAGKAIFTGLLEPPQTDAPTISRNTANTALVWHSGQLLAVWEAGAPHAIQVPELKTIGEQTYNDKLVSPFTAHPKVDPITGEMVFFGYSFTPPYLQYGIVSATGELLFTVPIEIPEPVMMHDFAITEDYTIFMDLPLTFNPARIQQGKPMIMFECDRPSRFGILPRHGDNSKIQWFESPACYVFHTLNAYQQGDEVVLIACRMSSTSVLGVNGVDDPDGNIPRLHQWRFNLKTGAVSESRLDDIAGEFPRVNENLLGRQTRYGYVNKSAPTPVPLFDGVIKYDFDHGTSQIHEFGQGRYGGESVFAPRPHATAEDDGWLMTFVHDETANTSELLVMNAQDITGEPVARVLIPQRVPYGFHAAWVTEKQLQGF